MHVLNQVLICRLLFLFPFHYFSSQVSPRRK